MMIWDGNPNLAIMLSVKHFTIWGYLDDLKGKNSTHLVKYLVATKIKLYLSLELRLITTIKSKSQIENGQGETIVANYVKNPISY